MAVHSGLGASAAAAGTRRGGRNLRGALAAAAYFSIELELVMEHEYAKLGSKHACVCYEKKKKDASLFRFFCNLRFDRL